MTDATTSTAAGTQPTDAAATTTQTTTEGTQAQASTTPAEPAKADEGTTPEAGQKEPEKPAGAPETYEFKAPEGGALSEDGIAAFGAFAKSQNLTQEAAQSLLDNLAPVMAKRQADQVAAIKAGWLESAQTDKEIGGAKLAENTAVAKKALEKFGTPELISFLNDSGLGDHPEVIRAFFKVGKAISEDTVVTGRQGQSSTAHATQAQRMYPNMNP
jgi:hypothetical protein